ncbi:DsrE family protein [Lewinella sp. IMCC34191]|uniref:DsrE family protein n=1 Tax=Lewinella sp. IMCC34191 TaxID=2259172 RepID=UPI000E25D4A5|nr:DsrE family protein [Lewinella sp. IMCC34191]
MARSAFRIFLFTLLGLSAAGQLFGQERVTPVVPFGGIYDIPEATVKPDPQQAYRIVVDVFTGSDDPDSTGFGLYNVARMVNLFAVGGVPNDSLDVVLAIHGGATFDVLTDAEYNSIFGVDNPNLPLIRALRDAGVKVTVCGQSLLSREVPTAAVAPEVEIATSMLTTVAHYQMLGYAVFRF